MGWGVSGVISLRADKDWLLGERRRMVRATVCHPVWWLLLQVAQSAPAVHFVGGNRKVQKNASGARAKYLDVRQICQCRDKLETRVTGIGIRYEFSLFVYKIWRQGLPET